MSKSKVFIIWNDKEIASKVSEKLKAYQYEGIVGGSEGAEGGRTIIDTVIYGMDQCDQAIAIMKKTKKNEQISANVFLELGYAMSKYGNMRTHLFYIDYDYNDVPSDLSGVWVDASVKSNEIKPTFASTDWNLFDQIDQIVEKLPMDQNMQRAVKDGYKNELWCVKNREEIAEKIVSSFLSHQKVVIKEEKIKVLGDYYHFRNYVIDHLESPHCSDYELAQYIIFLTQGAYMHNDMDDYRRYLERLHVNSHFSPELSIAVEYALLSVDVFQAILPKDYQSLNCNNFDDYRVSVNDYLKNIQESFNAIDDKKHTHFCIDDNVYKYAKKIYEDIRMRVERELVRCIYEYWDNKNNAIVKVTILSNPDVLSPIIQNFPQNVYDDFWLWLYASVFEMEQYIDFLYMLSFIEIGENQDTITSLYEQMKKEAEACNKITNILYCAPNETFDDTKSKNDQNDKNRYFVRLYQAYIYRNLFEAMVHLKRNNTAITDEELMYLEKSLNARKELLLYSKINPVTDMFEKQMEMEYYLALSKALEHFQDYPIFDYSKFFKYYNSNIVQMIKLGQYTLDMGIIINFVKKQAECK